MHVISHKRIVDFIAEYPDSEPSLDSWYRIARRATTIASLARVISEREVSGGLRRTLLTQARRLERLAARRVEELGIGVASGKKT